MVVFLCANNPFINDSRVLRLLPASLFLVPSVRYFQIYS